MTEIERMIAYGATPEDIYEQALAAFKEQQKKDERDALIADKRTAMIDSFFDYLEVITGRKAPAEDRKDMEKGFIELEESLVKMDKMKKPTVEKKKMSDDEKIRRFLKDIAAI